MARVRTALYSRARRINALPVSQLGGLKAFCGYDGAELLEHLERRHRQGCLLCGAPFATSDCLEVCHVYPLAGATTANTLAVLMELPNIGLAHRACNRRLGARPLQ